MRFTAVSYHQQTHEYLRVGHTENRIEDCRRFCVDAREVKINISLNMQFFPSTAHFFYRGERQFLCLLKESEKHTRREERRER